LSNWSRGWPQESASAARETDGLAFALEWRGNSENVRWLMFLVRSKTQARDMINSSLRCHADANAGSGRRQRAAPLRRRKGLADRPVRSGAGGNFGA